MQDQEIVRELEKFCAQYATVDRFLAVLRGIPELGTVSRSTYYRWLERPNRKTLVALEALSRRAEGASISVRVAVPEWLPIKLPVELLSWQPLQHLRFGAANKLGLRVERISTKSGGRAIDRLAAGEVDIAFAATSYESEAPVTITHDCRRVCTFVIAKLQALSVKQITNLSQLSDKHVGLPAESHLARPITAKYALSGSSSPKFDYREDSYATNLKNQSMQAVIGFQPWLDEVRASAKCRLYEAHGVDFGSLSLDIFVNLSRRNAVGIRLFIRAMTEVLRDLHPRMDRRFIEEVVKEFGRTRGEIEDMMQGSVYGFCNPDIETLLQLWEQDATHSRPAV